MADVWVMTSTVGTLIDHILKPAYLPLDDFQAADETLLVGILHINYTLGDMSIATFGTLNHS